MEKLFEGLDENSKLSVKDLKTRFISYEAGKMKKKRELQARLEQMDAMMKNLGGGTSSGVSGAPQDSFNRVHMTILKTLHPCLI